MEDDRQLTELEDVNDKQSEEIVRAPVTVEEAVVLTDVEELKEKTSIIKESERKKYHNCSICKIEDTELLDSIHFWRYSESKTLKDIESLIKKEDDTLDIKQHDLSVHFRKHFPVKDRAELAKLSDNKSVSKYFDQAVKERVKPVNELEETYERVKGYLDIFEDEAVIVKDNGKRSISASKVESLIRMTAEMRGILVELNKIRQKDALAKFCVNGFMTRFVSYLIKGLESEIESMFRDLKTRVANETELEDILNRTKGNLAQHIKDGARESLVDTIREFGIRG